MKLKQLREITNIDKDILYVLKKDLIKHLTKQEIKFFNKEFYGSTGILIENGKSKPLLGIYPWDIVKILNIND